MIETPQIVQSPEFLTAEIDIVVPRDEIMHVMGPAIGEIYGALAAQGITPAGPWFTHHKQRPTEVFDFRACVPVSKPVAAAGRVKPGTLTAATVARTIYAGPYEGLGGAWSELHEWVAKNGHTPRQDLWEFYVVGPESSQNPADWRTELNQPLVVS